MILNLLRMIKRNLINCKFNLWIKIRNLFNKNKLPSVKMLEYLYRKYQPANVTSAWLINDSYRRFKQRKQMYLVYRFITKKIPKDSNILDTGCSIGVLLCYLYAAGFKNLYGYDIDENAVKLSNQLASNMKAPINIIVGDAFNPPNLNERTFDIILSVGWLYIVPGYTLDIFIEKHKKYLRGRGYLIFDAIDSSFDFVENNQYLTHDWNKPENQRRPSEYRNRYSLKDIELIAKKYGFNVISVQKADANMIPRRVYVLKSTNK